ncbi:MAG: hypothetical protein K2P93_02355 [Alphaproteobacteria bacterium]|nr:hypothetical protein [Alphaproteobacteria bacterium]
MNEKLVSEGELTAIERKYQGLLKGNYLYEKDPQALREFIQILGARGILEPRKSPFAIQTIFKTLTDLSSIEDQPQLYATEKVLHHGRNDMLDLFSNKFTDTYDFRTGRFILKHEHIVENYLKLLLE